MRVYCDSSMNMQDRSAFLNPLTLVMGMKAKNMPYFLCIVGFQYKYMYNIVMKRNNENDSYTRKEGLVYKNQYHVIFCPK